MKLTWKIREATFEDAEGLEKSMKQAYESYKDRMGGVRLPPMDVEYSSEIESYPTWVVESEGSILGGLIMAFKSDSASIENIAVDPRYQGHGIGGELMRFAENKAKEYKIAELYLTTHVLLKENLSLYRHLGWEEIGRENTKIKMKKII